MSVAPKGKLKNSDRGMFVYAAAASGGGHIRRSRGQARSSSHTGYWSLESDPRVLEAVRKAVNLLDEG